MATRKEFKEAMQAFEKLNLIELTEIRNYVTWRIQNLKSDQVEKCAKNLHKKNPEFKFYSFHDDGIEIIKEIK